MNKIVLVTGGGAGIGQAACRAFAREGAKLMVSDLDSASGAATVDAIRKDGGEAQFVQADVSKAADVNAMVDQCIETYGQLDCAFNNAGIEGDVAVPITEASEETWDRVIDINLTGTMLLCRTALPHLVEGGGIIVNAASTAALSGLPCGVAYSASKGGVLAMTRSIAVEYAKRGVRANCVCPGDIKTDMTRGIDFPETMDYSLMGRISSLTGPKDAEVVAGVIAMLISDDGAHITGEDIRVDGGTLS